MSAERRNRAVVTLSGGLDSTVAAFVAAASYEIVLGLTFDYGQRASRRESAAGYAVAMRLGIAHRVIHLPFFREFGKSALLDRSRAVPTPDRQDLDDRGGKARASAQAVWVPNRNGVFVAIAAAWAEHLGAEAVVVGFNAEEARTFPDNSLAFVASLNEGLRHSTANGVRVEAPTGAWQKSEIVHWAAGHDVPLEVCWPCYHDPEQDQPCGGCESCCRFERAIDASGARTWFEGRKGSRRS